MSTYVTLVNKLLVRLNEVTLDTAGDGFDTVRNVQALAKNAINDAVRIILQEGEEWPFLKVTYTQTLADGTSTYSYPSDFSRSDFDTFYLKKHTTEQNSPAYLPAISHEDYTKNFRSLDDEGQTGVPVNVYDTAGDAFGVTPVPNAAYEVEYTYWSTPSDMTLYNDTCVIPTRFDYVVIDGAMMILMRFRSNEQSAAVHQNNFEKGIQTMRRVLMDQPLYVRSTVIQGSDINGR